MTAHGDKTDRIRGIAGNSRGYSITELVVVMVIFLTIMMITEHAFKTIVHSTARESKSAETQISGIVGLDILRADLEQAGFGLPWSFQNIPSGYAEASGAYESNYNDAPTAPPRAIVSGFNKTLFGSYTGSKYISIKSTVIANNETAKKWTSVTFNNNSTIRRSWGTSQRDFSANDKVIVVQNKRGDIFDRQLMVHPTTGAFFTTFSQYSTLTISHSDKNENYQIYGIAPTSTSSLRMPFNRADYYVGLPPTAGDMPASCAPKTGILYKATINHGNGVRSPAPLLDCVADLQIVYGLDTSESGAINDYTTVAPGTAEAQRSQIKELRVYVLAQEGGRDITYRYPSPTIDVGETLNGAFTGRRFNLALDIGDEYKYYRWKVYTIVVRPKNLAQ